MASNKGKKRRKKSMARTALRILLFTALAALACAYGAGCYLLRGRFLPHTYVNGVDYSEMTAGEAEAQFRSAYEGRVLTIEERGGGRETVNYDDIGYRITTGETFQQLIDSQNYYAWPLTYLEKTRIVTREGFEYSESRLEEALKNLECVKGDQVREPSDAEIIKTETGFTIRPEDEGTSLIFEKLLASAEGAVNRSETELDLEEADCYRKPEIYADDETLLSQIASIEKVENTEITLAMEGNVYVSLSKAVFLPWLSFSDGVLSIDESEVESYTNGLAEQYDTYLHKRSFVTYEGDTVEVGGGNYDNYGYQMDREKSAVIIRDAIMSGVSQTVALEWLKYGRTRDESGTDFGDTFIEISLDQQHMWFHQNGEITVSTSVVTGTATPTRATPTGCFQVLQVLKDHTMKGSYGESFANYVIAIMTNGIAIHDSSWRDSYGGDIWLYSGSHGCINTPYSAVQEIFENVTYGVPVIIYDRYNTVPEVHNEAYQGGEVEEDDEYEYDYEDYDYDYDYDGYYDEDVDYESSYYYDDDYEYNVYDDEGGDGSYESYDDSDY